MNKLQESLLELWKDVKRVFDKEKITYFAIGGTAIGALREGGFIPWDDDMDFCIIDKDYDRALIALENAGLSTKSKYLKFNPYPFDKVFGKDEISAFGERDNVYIDLFRAQPQVKWTKIGWFFFKTRDGILYAKSKLYRNWIKGSKGRFVYFGLLLAKWLISWLPTNFLYKKQLKAISKKRQCKKYDKNKRYMYYKENDTPMDITSIEEVAFENTFVNVSKTFAKDHRHIFGDIMKKPTKKINNHNISLVNVEENDGKEG